MVSSPVASATRLLRLSTSIAGELWDISDMEFNVRMKEWIVRAWCLSRALVLLILALTATSAYSASKTILVVGDSLSAEYGLARDTGWVTLLEQRLQRERVSAVVVNSSISGDTTSGGKTRLPDLLKKYRPNILILELGANDALRGLPLRKTETNLREMITAAKEIGASVLLVGMQIPPNYGPDYRKQFAGIYPKLAKETGSALVPFLFENLIQRPDLFQSDRIHPTAEAQPIMLDTVWPQLKPLLPSR
jgi:acyl-CoA thioesterase-1